MSEEVLRPFSPREAASSDAKDTLQEQLRTTQDSIRYLQSEHALMLRGLHQEIERLNNLCRDLQFRCETGDLLLPDGEFFQCSPKLLEQKVSDLIKDNSDLKRKLAESHQAIDILDQKEKLALWQHHQELEERDSAILKLEKEVESKNSTIQQLTQGSRKKKGNFWRRFSFISADYPSTSSVPQPRRVEHLSREDLPSEIQNSLHSQESHYQSYSSYSSLSDKSVSDDEGFPQRCDAQSECGDPKQLTVKLPPISTRQTVRHQLRLNSRGNSLAIDQIQPPDVKRLNKAQ